MIAPKFVRLMDSGSPRKPQLLLHPGSRNLHSYIKESMRLIGDRMDVDEGSMQHNQHEISEDSTLMLDASRRHISENMQVSTGLIHYYSAPSSVLASITNEDEELLAPLNKSEDSEFAQFLSDTLSSVATSSEDSDRTTLYINEISDAGDPLNNQQHSSGHLGYKRIVSPNTRFKRVAENNIVNSVDHVSLSAISEHGTELNSNNFCSSRMSILHTQQGTSNNHIIGGSMNPSSALVSSATTYSGTSQESTGLARNSSLPARLLSRLVLEEYGETGKIERPGSSLPNSYIQPPLECSPNRTYSKQDTLNSPVRGYGMTSTFTGTNGIAVEVPSKKIDKLDPSEALTSPSTGGLLRQSSSPAGLLSRLSLDGIMEVNRQFMMPSASGSSSGECGLERRGSDFIPNFEGGMWDDPISPQGNIMHGTATLATKKRVRQLEAKMLTGSTLLDSDQMTVLERGASLPAHFSVESATSPESQLTVDRGSSDAVLCRARAKRGCATHPRSIAERVRRTKISERMKKLQELVPNMDKQTNTADMLDEAVEYVKFLQRQVQELSESQHKCDCSSQQKNS